MKKAGVNSTMPKGPVGTHSTRINPVSFARNNLSKGGVNNMMNGSIGKSTGTAKRK